MGQSLARVDGLVELRRELKRLGVGVQDLKDANQQAAQLVADEAARRAPRRSGRLASSGRAGRGEAKAVVTFGGAAVPYARPIHWGWPARNIEPHPFAMTAGTDTQPRWLELYRKALDELVEEVARGVAS